ncbi:hypothetical protein KO317_02395 [Candidatus Micrarchaeota archaeon]|jgi:hypothetical protein|nr:hypothetical protein [Candidatus Micrarchaeota archaeon]
MGKVYFTKDTEPTKFVIEQIYDLAGRLILHGTVMHGVIKPGIEGKVKGKEFILEHIEQKNIRLDYLEKGETGDLVIKSRDTLKKIHPEDFGVGKILLF